jgi:hypothetical protein
MVVDGLPSILEILVPVLSVGKWGIGRGMRSFDTSEIPLIVSLIGNVLTTLECEQALLIFPSSSH